jgi:signal peptidase I
VPSVNLVGRAEILFYSIDARDPWWQFWMWPVEIRWSRIGTLVR